MTHSTSSVTCSITDDSGTSLLFRRCLEKDLHAPNESQGYNFHASVGVLYFSQSQHRKPREQTPLLLCSCALFRADKRGSQELHRAALLTTKFFCTLGMICRQEIPKPLETHCWIPPGNFHCWIPPKRMSVRHAGIVLPVVCLTSLSLAGVSLPSCLSCWSEQPVLGREGSCLAGPTGPGPGGDTSTGIF